METEEILAVIQKAAETIATPNWADKWAVILSVLAIIAATTVAFQQVKIQKQQNRIALFEKRYKTYNELSKVLTLTNNFEFAGNLTLYEYYVAVLLALNYPEPQEGNRNIFIYTLEMDNTIFLIQQATFLFPDISENDINDLAKKFKRFFANLITTAPEKKEIKLTEYFDTDLIDFIKANRYFSEKYLDTIKNHLNFER